MLATVRDVGYGSFDLPCQDKQSLTIHHNGPLAPKTVLHRRPTVWVLSALTNTPPKSVRGSIDPGPNLSQKPVRKSLVSEVRTSIWSSPAQAPRPARRLATDKNLDITRPVLRGL